MNPKDNIVAQNLQDGHELESGAFDRVSDSVDVQVLPFEVDLTNSHLLLPEIKTENISNGIVSNNLTSLGKLEEV